MLSIVLNTYIGTDLLRFSLLLHTLVYDVNSSKHSHSYIYAQLTKNLLNGWAPGIGEQKKSLSHKIVSEMERLNCSRLGFKSDQVEVLLIVDGGNGNEPVYLIKEFKRWAQTYKVARTKIVLVPKIGLTACRNIAIKKTTGKFVMFRDDDDYSAPIAKLLEQVYTFASIGAGTNDLSYWTHVPSYNSIQELRHYFEYYQKKPVIAILADGIKIRNGRANNQNPFGRAEFPVKAEEIEVIDRPSRFCMATKIFSRESLYYIHNTLNCTALEDLRTHHLQVLPQHCIWFVRPDMKKRIRRMWRSFVTGKDFNLEDMRWFNFVILTYNEWRVPYSSIQNLFETPFKKKIMEALIQPEGTPIYFGSPEIGNMIERCRHANDIIENKLFSSTSSPSFIYVLPTGCYAQTSHAWGTIISAIEACWHSGKVIEFSKEELKWLKCFITKSVYTTVEKQNNGHRISIRTPNDNAYAKRICWSLNSIANTTHLFCDGYVHNPQDWTIITGAILRIRNALRQMHDDPLYREVTIAEPDPVPDSIHSYNEYVNIVVNNNKELIDLMPMTYEPKHIVKTGNKNEKLIHNFIWKMFKGKMLIVLIILSILIISTIISYARGDEE